MGQGAAHGGVLCGLCGQGGRRGLRAAVGGCVSGPHKVGAPRGGRGGTGVHAGRAEEGGSGGGGDRGAGSAACGSTGYGAHASGPVEGLLPAPGDGQPRSAVGGAGSVGVRVVGEGLRAGEPEEGASLSYSQIRSPGGRMN